MLPVTLLVVIVVALAAAALVVRRKRPVAEPEPAPHARRAVLAAAVAPAATISGAVAPPRLSGHDPVSDTGYETVRTSGRIREPVRPGPGAGHDEALHALDALLAELESTTVLIDRADALDERAVAELDALASRLEAAAESFAAR